MTPLVDKRQYRLTLLYYQFIHEVINIRIHQFIQLYLHTDQGKILYRKDVVLV